MEDAVSFIGRMIASIQDPFYWSFAVPVPVRPESAALVLAIVFLVWVVPLIVRSVRDKGHELNIETTDLPDDSAPAMISVQDGQKHYPNVFPSAETKSKTRRIAVVIIKDANRKRHVLSCEVQLNQGLAKGQFRLSKKLKRSVANGTGKVIIRWPFWRLDLYSFRSPDRDVALQWKMGTLFLVLGVLIPRVL